MDPLMISKLSAQLDELGFGIWSKSKIPRKSHQPMDNMSPSSWASTWAEFSSPGWTPWPHGRGAFLLLLVKRNVSNPMGLFPSIVGCSYIVHNSIKHGFDKPKYHINPYFQTSLKPWENRVLSIFINYKPMGYQTAVIYKPSFLFKDFERSREFTIRSRCMNFFRFRAQWAQWLSFPGRAGSGSNQTAETWGRPGRWTSPELVPRDW